MKKLSIVKHATVIAPNDEYHKTLGIVAFQLVDISFNFFNSKVSSQYDTKIMEDGRQLIIGGDGWFKGETDITQLLAA